MAVASSKLRPKVSKNRSAVQRIKSGGIVSLNCSILAANIRTGPRVWLEQSPSPLKSLESDHSLAFVCWQRQACHARIREDLRRYFFNLAIRFDSARSFAVATLIRPGSAKVTTVPPARLSLPCSNIFNSTSETGAAAECEAPVIRLKAQFTSALPWPDDGGLRHSACAIPFKTLQTAIWCGSHTTRPPSGL
jgi:hypothetical protein